MSLTAMVWVLYESTSTGHDRLVLLSIADEANDDGWNAHPSIDRIAAKARVDRSTVIRSITRLEADGELLVKRPEKNGRGRFNRYALTMGRDPVDLASSLGWAADEERSHAATDQNDTTSAVDNDEKGRAKGRGKVAETSQDRPLSVALGATRPMTRRPFVRTRETTDPIERSNIARQQLMAEHAELIAEARQIESDRERNVSGIRAAREAAKRAAAS